MNDSLPSRSPADEIEPSPRCTVVCATNDPAVLESHLLANLPTQSTTYRLILSDSRVVKQASAAAALNAAARDADTDWIIFAHQDVDLQHADFLERLLDYADALPDAGVIGVVGVEAGDGRAIRLVNQIDQGPDGKTFRLRGRPIDQPAEVETVDEMLFAIPKRLFGTLPFDERACPHWDLYAVDYCLSARARGWKCYVVPLSLRHLSVGKVRGNYYRTLARLLPKHRKAFRTIFTTCGTWHTWQPMYYQRVRKTAAAGLARLMQFVRRPA